MEGYLGEFPVDIAQTEFDGYEPSDWAMYFIEKYGQIDGDHHKAWVLDQVARVLKGSPVRVVEARWSNGESEYRVTVGTVSMSYDEWIERMRGAVTNEDGEPDYEYDYNEGIAP